MGSAASACVSTLLSQERPPANKLLGVRSKDGRWCNLRRPDSAPCVENFLPRGGIFTYLEELRERFDEINRTLLRGDPGPVDSRDVEVLDAGTQVKREITAAL